MPIPIDKATKLVEDAWGKSPKREFRQTVDVALTLQDIDIKKPENRIREVIELPNTIPGKQGSICVIADGDIAIKAREVADEVMGKEDLERLAANKKDAKKLARRHDFFLARADMMPAVGKSLGSTLGPLGKMADPVPPNADIASISKRYRRSVRIRIKDQPLIQCRVGAEDMEPRKIGENVQAVVSAVERRFSSQRCVKRVSIKTTMGRAVSIKP